jgi:hypothetical protein
MRRFFFVLLLLFVGLLFVGSLSDVIGVPSLMTLYLKLMVSVMALTFVYGVLKAIFFPSPIVVVVVEPRPRRRWFKWASNRASSQ